MNLIPFEGHSPRIDPSAFVAPGARLIGRIELGVQASIWYNVVLRGDNNLIRIGARSNVQDGSVIHVDPPRPDGPEKGYPAIIGDDVLIGHMAMLHGCTLHDHCLVGLGAIVMNGCVIESDAMLAAGAVLTQNKRIPSGQLWEGRPARYRRDLTDAEIEKMRQGVAHYAELGQRHRAALAAASD